MSGALKSALTLAALAVLLVVAAAWGWSALTEPFPQEEPVAICESTDVPAGGEVRRDEVVVSVFNGSKRSGLAGSTMAELTERGFVEGQVGDSPQPAKNTQVWSSDPTNPAVLLVKKQFRGADIVPGDSLGDGITVVLGEKFTSLRKKQVESVTAKSAATFCRATSSDAE